MGASVQHIHESIFAVKTAEDFNEICLEIFRFQAANCAVYADYVKLLGIDPQSVSSVEQIPFLPISFFKTHKVACDPIDNPTIFLSSGTTGMEQSQHLVRDISLYEASFRKGFEQFYGPISNYCVLALLPSYLEREGSSLIYMVNDLIEQSGHADSGFYLRQYDEIAEKLRELETKEQPTLLLGVTYALLDLIEQEDLNLRHTIIMETGGMKGKRKEMVREELHETLCNGFGVDAIHSEYGMTEMLSQAYSLGDGLFDCVPWMHILIRQVNDPFQYNAVGRTGGINVIDLANLYSCSFIATQDLGKTHPNGQFEVLGRFDNSDIRGCNLLIE